MARPGDGLQPTEPSRAGGDTAGGGDGETRASADVVPRETVLPDAQQTSGGSARGKPGPKRKRATKRAAKNRALRQLQLQAAIAAWEAEVTALPPRGVVPPLPYRPSDYAEAHAATVAERAAIAPRDVRKANVKAGNVVTLVLRLVPLLDRLRPCFASLPVDLALIDRIDTLARSFGHSDALASGALDPTATDPWDPRSKRVLTPRERLRKLLERTVEARRSLNSEVRNLIVQGKLPKAAVAGLRGGAGYDNVARDVLTLVAILREAPPHVRAASAIGEAILDEYAKMAYDLTHSRAQLSQRSEKQRQAWDDRARAFTLLWAAYSQAQRALTFILWDRMKVTDVLPTLMVGVGRKKAPKPKAT